MYHISNLLSTLDSTILSTAVPSLDHHGPKAQNPKEQPRKSTNREHICPVRLHHGDIANEQPKKICDTGIDWVGTDINPGHSGPQSQSGEYISHNHGYSKKHYDE